MAGIQKYQQANVQTVSAGGNAGDTGLLAKAQGKVSLAQRLDSFSSQLTGIAKQSAHIQGAKDATVDIQTRKAKVHEIQNNDKLDDIQKENQISKIVEGADKKTFGVYSQSYESAASSAYSNQIQSDSKSAYDLAMVGAQGSPEIFMEMYSKFSQETVKGAPTPATAIMAQDTTMGYGTAGYKSLMLAKMSANSQANKATWKNANEALTAQFSDAYYQQDIIGQTKIFNQIISAGEAAVRDGHTTQPEHEMNMQNIANTAIIDSVTRKFGEEVNVGRGDVVYDQFRIAEKNGMFETVDPDEISKMKSSMLKQIKEFNNGELERKRYEKESYEAISDETFREGSAMAASGRLTEAQITQWESGSTISTSHADSLRERLATGHTRKVSDAQSLSRFAESTVLIDTDNEYILSDPSLSEADKTSLIGRKEALQEGKYNWTKTNDGKEAVRRIKSNFGIQEGTLMAKIDLNNQTMRDFDNLYKEFYASVSASPNPSQDVLPFADKLLSDYKQKAIEAEAAKAQKREAARIEKAKNDAAVANDSILVKIGWKDPVGYESMMLEK